VFIRLLVVLTVHVAKPDGVYTNYAEASCVLCWNVM